MGNLFRLDRPASRGAIEEGNLDPPLGSFIRRPTAATCQLSHRVPGSTNSPVTFDRGRSNAGTSCRNHGGTSALRWRKHPSRRGVVSPPLPPPLAALIARSLRLSSPHLYSVETGNTVNRLPRRRATGPGQQYGDSAALVRAKPTTPILFVRV